MSARDRKGGDTTEEVWKPVAGYEGFYEASSLGRIRSVDRENIYKRKDGIVVCRKKKGKVLIPQYDGRHLYLHVYLTKNGEGRTELLHRIIAKTFIDNPLNLPEVNHIDENKTNNVALNLEWCDHIYNNHYGAKATASRGEKNAMNRIPEAVIKEIKDSFVPGDTEYGVAGLAKKYNISQTHVCAITKGRRWGWL